MLATTGGLKVPITDLVLALATWAHAHRRAQVHCHRPHVVLTVVLRIAFTGILAMGGLCAGTSGRRGAARSAAFTRMEGYRGEPLLERRAFVRAKNTTLWGCPQRGVVGGRGVGGEVGGAGSVGESDGRPHATLRGCSRLVDAQGTVAVTGRAPRGVETLS